MYDVFKSEGDVIVLVEGSPGIGKTTFCLKIAYDWAHDPIPKEFNFPQFEIVLLLKCRDIVGDLFEAITEQLLPKDTYECFCKKLMEFIKDFHFQPKVLIILDGLDELPKVSESYVDDLLRKKVLRFCYVLATTRQERGIAVRQKVNFDMLLQIEGFTRKDAFDYIRKYFKSAGSEHISTGERLIIQIEKNTLLDALWNNPLNLLLLCVVFEDYQGELPSYRTELYQIIVSCILRRYCAKHDLEAPLVDKALVRLFEDSLLVLGELAWRCLEKDRFSFFEKELAEFETKNVNLAARELGLVFKEASLRKINPQHEYFFFHKTFQEYLAALYLANKLLIKEVDFFKSHLRFYPDMVESYRQVFIFMSGILGEDACLLFEQIGKKLKEGNWDWHQCAEEEATFFVECFNESRNGEQVAIALSSFIPFPQTMTFDLSDGDMNTDISIVFKACGSFSQLQLPVHLSLYGEVPIDEDGAAPADALSDIVAPNTQLQTLSFSGCVSEEITALLCKALTVDSTLHSFTLETTEWISSCEVVDISDSLAANKTLTTVTLKLPHEVLKSCIAILDKGLSAETPLTSFVLEIFGSWRETEAEDFRKILLNRSLMSLSLTLFGDVQDSLITSLREGLVANPSMKSLALTFYGKLSNTGVALLKNGFLGNRSLESLELKVFGELPTNWANISRTLHSAVKSTSRQERGIIVRKKVDFDMLLQIEGFTREDAFDYIRKHFKNAGPENVLKGERLIDEIMENTFLDALWNNPLNLLLLCIVFEDYQGELPSYRTELYQIIVSCILRRYCAKHDLEAPVDDKNVVRLFEDSLLVLGELAWRCLEKDRFSFREEELVEFETVNANLAARELGLVFKEASLRKINPQHEYFFFHKTFQEYLAAFYLANKLLKKEVYFSELHLNFYNDMTERYRQVFIFMSGILGEDARLLFEQIGKKLKKGNWDWHQCAEEGATFFVECFTESRNDEQVAIALSSFIPFPQTMTFNLSREETTTGVFIVLKACESFSQLQLPVHLALECSWWDVNANLGGDELADIIASNTQLQTLSFSGCVFEETTALLCKALTVDSTLHSFTLETTGWIYSCEVVAIKLDCSGANDLCKGLIASSVSCVTLNFKERVTDNVANCLFKHLNKLKTLSKLTISIQGELMGDGKNTLERLSRNQTYLFALNVSDSYSGDKICREVGLSADDSSSLTPVLTKVKDGCVTKLSLSVKNPDSISGDWGSTLCEGLAKSESLTTLSLTFNNNYYIKNMDALWDAAAKNKSLTTLSLTLNSYNQYLMSEPITFGLRNGLAKNSSLTTLSLTLNDCLVWKKMVANDLRDGLAKNASLTTLRLTMNIQSGWIIRIPLVDYLSGGLAKNTSLTTLSLTLNNYCDWEECMISGLNEGLTKNMSLTTLILTFNNYRDFEGCMISDLSDVLTENMSLTTLSLTLNNYRNFEGSMISDLSDVLTKNMSLTTLILAVNNYSDFKGCMINGRSDRMAKYMSLTTLSLAINNYSSFEEDLTDGLIDGLANIKSLTTLSLTLNNHSYRPNSSFCALMDALVRNTSIVTLNLTLGDYNNFYEDWIHELAYALARDTSLTSISLEVNVFSERNSNSESSSV
ncbi:uncharacterized protein LOC111340006 [Stylophora pistillata]|uniref:uncharacterized protein LOC111340006 n=1 Tax=Stylophora pistillata TaxID=50429 RepID=UPI000C056693|nr:uncharacterized protein LOC111340006 [Stylophora pistillata]